MVTYGYEVMVPVEVEVPSHRRISYSTEKNKRLKEAALDLIQETWDEIEVVAAATYRQRMAKTYNARLKGKKLL